MYYVISRDDNLGNIHHQFGSVEWNANFRAPDRRFYICHLHQLVPSSQAAVHGCPICSCHSHFTRSSVSHLNSDLETANTREICNETGYFTCLSWLEFLSKVSADSIRTINTLGDGTHSICTKNTPGRRLRHCDLHRQGRAKYGHPSSSVVN